MVYILELVAISDHGAYYFDKYGFKRALYSGVMCSDPCYYTGCDMQTYLNPGEAEKDYVTNMEIYSDAIAKCKLAASCTEKTATFKISVDYKQKDDSGNIVKDVIKIVVLVNNIMLDGVSQEHGSTIRLMKYLIQRNHLVHGMFNLINSVHQHLLKTLMKNGGIITYIKIN